MSGRSLADMRLQKFLSRAGVASRRHAEEMIAAGRVRVNGSVVSEMGSKVDPERDRVEVDGKRVGVQEATWIALYKPAGYVTTRSDPRGRPTVYDLLPDAYHGLFHVGRLDWASEGLLLLTNQGDVAHRLLHPSFEIERVYDAVVTGELSRAMLARLTEGVELEDGLARAERAELRSTKRPGQSAARLVLREGRNREVRRMFAALGFPVKRLVRRRYGPIELGRMKPGEWRVLASGETARLGRSGRGTTRKGRHGS